jgi:hypothetical protein
MQTAEIAIGVLGCAADVCVAALSDLLRYLIGAGDRRWLNGKRARIARSFD